VLTFTTLPTPIAGPGPGNGLPILDAGGARPLTTADWEVLGGKAGYVDRFPTVLPYDAQDSFDRTVEVRDLRVAVLENDRLKATFLLDLGGRLWTLYDKVEERELLYQPDTLMHGNLALRQAWFSGGVEWNLGFTGHWPLTSSPVSAGRVQGPQDYVGASEVSTGRTGEVGDVLRLWAYERMLGLVWRLDAWLPDGAEDLYVRVVLHNPYDRVVPVYWWSTIAVPQVTGGRVLIPATQAVSSGYKDLAVVNVTPERLDPASQKYASDMFCDLLGNPEPWVAAVDAAGLGMQQTSTPRLRGRKLFVWGTATGGESWQAWLGGKGRYCEIQAGLGPTQLHHLPLASGDTWTWTEAYGPLSFTGATGEQPPRATQVADADHALSRVQDAPAVVEVSGDGWGALAVAAGDLPTDPATPFPAQSLGAAQRPWLAVLGGQALTGSAAPVSGPGWRARLDEAPTSPERDLHLGYHALARGKVRKARKHWRAVIAASPSAAAFRALGLTGDDPAERAAFLAQAVALDDNPSLLIEYATAALAVGHAADVVARIEKLDPNGPRRGRFQLVLATAYIALGRLDEARAILGSHLVVPDIREGAATFTQVWHAYQTARGTTDPLPAEYDFRMRPDA
jgi:hypothetical protein